jgi:hypothetical protein
LGAGLGVGCFLGKAFTFSLTGFSDFPRCLAPEPLADVPADFGLRDDELAALFAAFFVVFFSAGFFAFFAFFVLFFAISACFCGNKLAA